jgi:hypothetical protein
MVGGRNSREGTLRPVFAAVKDEVQNWDSSAGIVNAGSAKHPTADKAGPESQFRRQTIEGLLRSARAIREGSLMRRLRPLSSSGPLH